MSLAAAPRRLLGFAALLALLLLLPTLSYGLGFDHGFMQYIGRGILRGEWPYANAFDTLFPAIYLLHMTVIAIGGQSVLALRVADLLIQIANALLLFTLARRIGGARAGFVAVAIYTIAYTNGTYYHTAERDSFLTPLLLAAVWGVWRFLETPARRGPLIWGAACAGLACLFRPTYALVVALAALALLRRQPRKSDAVTFAGVAAVPILAFLIVYLVSGHRQALADLFTYLTTVYVLVERKTKTVVLMALWRNVPLVAWIGTALAVVGAWSGAWRTRRRELWTIVGLFLACVLVRLWESKGYRYQYWPCVASLSIVAALGWDWAVTVPPRVAAAAVLVGVLAAEMGRTGLARYATMWPDVAPTGSAAFTHMVSDSRDQAALAEYLTAHTGPDDRIQMWGPETIALFATGRTSATRFIDSFMFVCQDPKDSHHMLLFTDCGPGWNKPVQVAFRRELMEQLNARPPLYIGAHYADGTMAIDTTYSIAPDLPELRALIDQRYVREATFGPWSAFRRTDR